jgi:hypothetical protein
VEPIAYLGYEVRIGVFDRPYDVIYLTPGGSVSYALAYAESMAMQDGLLGKHGFKQHDISVDYGRVTLYR